MTEKENVMNILERTGKAQWLPVTADCCFTLIPSPIRDRPVPVGVDGLDWFGCKWYFDKASNGYAQNPGDPLPLKELEQWREQVRFPDLDACDWAACAVKDLQKYDRDRVLLRVFTESGPFERLHQLYGFENAFLAMYEYPEAFLELMDALSDFKVEIVRRLGRYYKPDIVFAMDDLGSNRGPLLSLEMYRALIKPFDAKIVQAIHDIGARVVYHSCGCMQAFVEDLIDIGVDMLHPFQGGINDQKMVQEKYGDELFFAGCLDNLVQKTEVTEEELRAEMRRVINLFRSKQNIFLETSTFWPERKKILIDEARKCGKL